MLLEVLNFALVLLRLFKRIECAEVAALSAGVIFLARVQTELAGFEFANRVKYGCCGQAQAVPRP
jgi:hypothetical protein